MPGPTPASAKKSGRPLRREARPVQRGRGARHVGRRVERLDLRPARREQQVELPPADPVGDRGGGRPHLDRAREAERDVGVVAPARGVVVADQRVRVGADPPGVEVLGGRVEAGLGLAVDEDLEVAERLRGAYGRAGRGEEGPGEAARALGLVEDVGAVLAAHVGRRQPDAARGAAVGAAVDVRARAVVARDHDRAQPGRQRREPGDRVGEPVEQELAGELRLSLGGARGSRRGDERQRRDRGERERAPAADAIPPHDCRDATPSRRAARRVLEVERAERD